jgi:hypothetical protein
MSADSRRTTNGDEAPPMSRIEELFADRAVQPLSAEEQHELERLLADSGDRGHIDAGEFDRAAAAIDLALGARRHEPMPAALRDRIGAGASLSATQFRSAHHRAIADGARALTGTPRVVARSSVVLWSGWIAAAAVLAFTSLLLFGRSQWKKVANPPGSQLVEAVNAASDKLAVPWKPTDDPDGKSVRGEIVWSSALQSGFMRFTGLPKNDPATHQYQLWIFDTNQDERYPIDGGVFDVSSANGEVIVPIRAELTVAWPKMFAVTKEKPGGVVVSAREHLVALAQI